ncbi:MAG: hypothetical protein AUJ01_01890 [Acidobacteria bacterium 13_1_40CM_3_65_5]|nr:MAG: hypothetical protein AUH72_04875 [Acidobacteria bacterium 13_1_40CM_4_65_8]OLD21589.1 MAG: hypothetical protein AUJ01_01890 [Acidobacteria bacterium 13_1_40CM_3_65_5]OLE82689.1 MAG: hypothetical protein AUF76_08485 [Acidobacteria bacterium 13_1_20CM_2_65_9]
MQSPRSDLDLLVITDDIGKLPQAVGPIHVQALTPSTFVERLRDGDDFAAWCIRYGVPLVNSSVWKRIASSEQAQVWPDWRKKTPHALRRLLLADSLVASDDLDAAIEEMLFAISHVGRAVLLKSGTFPLSRPEMIRQLREADYRALSNLLSAFLNDAPDVKTVDKARRYLKRLLVSLDKSGYQREIQVRRRAHEKKQQHAIRRGVGTRRKSSSNRSHAE